MTLLTAVPLLLVACGKSSVPTGLATACGVGEGTAVELTGYVYLPTFRETVQMSREGEIVAIGHIVVLTERSNGSGSRTLLSVRETTADERNRIKRELAISRERTLFIIGNDGRPVTEGTLVVVTGVTIPDDSAGCFVDAKTIEPK